MVLLFGLCVIRAELHVLPLRNDAPLDSKLMRGKSQNSGKLVGVGPLQRKLGVVPQDS
jgi:hypothetical protein